MPSINISAYRYFLAERKEIVLIAFFLIALVTLQHELPRFSDVQICYIPAGVKYITKWDLLVNFEHPPMAKYIIGLSYIFLKEVKIPSILFSIVTTVVFYYLVALIYESKSIAFYLTLLLASDTLFLATSSSSLLDVYMLTFLIIALYIGFGKLKKKSPRISTNILFGVFSGLAIACKLSALFFIVPFLILYILRLNTSIKNKLASLFTIVLIVTMVYVSSYTPLFINGYSLMDFLNLQYSMVSYHVARHSPTFYTIYNAFTRLFFKFTILRSYYLGHFIINVTEIKSEATTTIAEIPLEKAQFLGYKVTFYAGLGGLATLIFLPSLIALTYITCFKRDKYRKYIVLYEGMLILAVMSVFNAMLTISIAWYYYLSQTFLYMTIPVYVQAFFKENETYTCKLLKVLIVLNFISLILLGLGLASIDFYIKPY